MDLIDIEKINNNLQLLCKKQNDIIRRITGITDVVLKEQLSEEYNDIELQINILNISKNEFENNVYKSIFSSMVDELFIFYNSQYKIESDIIKAIEITNNISIRDILISKRIRIPDNLSDRRLLCNISNLIRKQIILKDLENNIYDEIGNYEEQIVIYIYALTKYIKVEKLIPVILFL